MKNLKPKPAGKVATLPEPKPQIPAMMQALRRQRENARALIDGLETKLSPVLRPGSGALAGVSDSFSEATPLTEQLTETISVMSLLNARLRDITARLEL